MHEIAKKILSNKPEYSQHLKELDNKYNSIFTKKLYKEKNEINILSIFCEMEFGYILNNIFEKVTYEPKIHGKTPDWLVISNNQKIIFEVKNINPREEEIQERIDLAKEDKYSGTSKTAFSFAESDFQSQILKILAKEETYRHLIINEGYQLIICFDVVNLQENFITDTDIKLIFDFENKYSLINKYSDFCKNIAGVIAKPIFPKTVFIENSISGYKLNNDNLKCLNTINLSSI